VILANSLFNVRVKLENVRIEGIRNVGKMIKEAKRLKKRVKLICRVSTGKTGLEMSVAPRFVASDDPLCTVNGGDMALKLFFKTCQQIFVSAQFTGVKQTAYAVLNDIIKLDSALHSC
jgi:homoserine dehydrogenase